MDPNSSFVPMPSLIVLTNVVEFFLYSLSSINYSLYASIVFLLSSPNCNRDTFFGFINSKFVKTLSFSFFSLVNAFTLLSKALCYFLWKNNVLVHFLFVVSQISTFCLKFYNFSSCDFSHDVLPLSSSFSSYSFLYKFFFLSLCPHYYKMWVQFTSPRSLDQWIHSKSNETIWLTGTPFIVVHVLPPNFHIMFIPLLEPSLFIQFIL